MSNDSPARIVAVMLPVSSTYHATSRIRDIVHGLDNVGIDLSRIEISVPADVVRAYEGKTLPDGAFEVDIDGAHIKLRPQETSK